MTSTYKWILSVFLLIVFISSIVFLVGYRNEASDFVVPDTTQDVVETNKFSSIIEEPPEPLVKRKVDTSHYVQCFQVLREYYSADKYWDKQIDWYLLLDEGYTLDAVSNAITFLHHDNINFAILFRLEFERKNSELNRSNELLNEKINRKLPELAEANKEIAASLMSANSAIVSVSFQKELPIPSIVFEGLSSKTFEEKRKILASQQPRVDDLAYFIESDELSDEDILLMLEYLPNPSQIVGYTRVDSSSLLDYATQNARLKVVEALLKRGLMPSTDKYQLTTFEFALSGLDEFFDTERRKDAVALVRLFEGMGGAARLEKQSLDEVTSQFMRFDFRFSKEQINSLLLEDGLDLSVIASRPLVQSDPDAPLVKALLRRKKQALRNKMTFSNVEETVDACNKTENEIRNKWKPKSVSSFVWQFSQKNDLNEADMKAALGKIHPLIADHYPTRKVSTRRKTKRDLQRYTRLLDDPNNGQFFFDRLAGKTLSDEERSVLFMAMLRGKAHSIDEVVNSEFFSSDKNYYWLSWALNEEILEALESTSLDMRSTDEFGKTLLFYATEKKTTNLLEYLYEHDYPFHQATWGEDPLHKTLKQANSERFIHKALAKIDVLMRYEPKIDKFHLQYMALLKLKYIDTYNQIVKKHPKLTVNEDTVLPEFN
jgi:hypothetical protein